MRLINSLKNRLNLKPPACAGLHVTASSLQLLQLSKAGDAVQVNQYAKVSWSAETIFTEVSKESPVLIQAIKDLQAETKNIAIALPDEAIIIKTIQLSAALTEFELAKIIPHELERSCPYALQDMYYDFQVINHYDQQKKSVDVLVVATQKQKIESMLNVLSAAGLQTMIVEAETHAVERACQFFLTHWQSGHSARIVAILLVSKMNLTLMIWRDRQIVFSRVEIMSNPERSLLVIMLYVRRSLQFFLASAQAMTIEQFLVLDENGFSTDLVSHIQLEFKVTANVANLPTQFLLEEKLSRDVLICFGLALRGSKQ